MRWLKWGVPLVLFLLLLAYCGMALPIDLLFTLAVGWLVHLWRVVPRIEVNLAGVGTALVCLAFLGVGLHHFAGWLYRNVGKGEEPRVWRFRWTASILGGIVLMFVAGIAAVGVTHQSYWLATSPEPLTASGFREAVNRASSQNNLKQATLSVLKHCDDHGEDFRLGVLLDERGEMLHGYHTLILPNLEQETLYNSIDLRKPWNHPVNAQAMQTEVKVFTQPAIDERSRDGYALTHYAGNVHVLGARMPRYPGGFPDGVSQTIMIGEVSTNLKPWGHPVGWRDPGVGLHTSPDGFGGPFKGVTQFSLCDGSVRTVTDKVSIKTLRAASTPAGGEILGDDW